MKNVPNHERISIKVAEEEIEPVETQKKKQKKTANTTARTTEAADVNPLHRDFTTH